MIKLLVTFLLATQLATVPPDVRKPPTGEDRWVTYPCTAGTLDPTSMRPEPLPDGYVLVTLDGRLECGLPATDRSQFGVGVFTLGDGGAVVHPSMRQRYATTAPTVFHTSVPVKQDRRIGLCLFAEVTPALSCVAVSAAGDGTATAEPLDPARWPFGATGPGGETHPQPQCNTCWTSRR